MPSGTDSSGIERRQYVRAMIAAGLGGLAGCNSGGGNEGGDTGGNTTTTETTTTVEDSKPPEPVADSITVGSGHSKGNKTLPQNTNYNPWSSSTKAVSKLFFQEMGAPVTMTSDEFLLSGHSWEMPHIDWLDEVTIETWQKDYRVEAPFDVYETFNENLSYWDGTKITAEAQMMHDYLNYATVSGNITDETVTFNSEVVGEFEYHWWRDKGEVEGQEANPTNAKVLRSQVPRGYTPEHPSFTRPWYEKFQDATTSDEVQSVIDNLSGVNVPVRQWMEKGWGSGLYELDEVQSNETVATLREDHPNAEHATISEVRHKWAAPSRMDILKNEGQIDIGTGIVQPDKGLWARNSIPDYIQEIDRFLSTGGDQMLINANNKHLQNLWVRRAMVAAVDWLTSETNGWGAEMSVPNERHTGMLKSSSETYFSEDFLNSLYTYPMSSDMELAAQWMRKAGYTKEGGTWTSPDGTPVDLTLLITSGVKQWVAWAQTVKANLESFGFKIELISDSFPNYNNALKPSNLNFDISIQWGPNVSKAWQAYDGLEPYWTHRLVAGGKNSEQYRIPEDAEVDDYNYPMTVQIPTEVGSIEGPDQAGRKPDLSCAGIDAEEIHVPSLIYELRGADTSEERFQEVIRKCARFYNYYLPDFQFHQLVGGYAGNVRDYTFPPENHPANVWGGPWQHRYTLYSGTVQISGDQEYTPPNQ